MKNNYPIKYAVVPIMGPTNWACGLNSLEKEYGIESYIVSKCYLVKETKSYNMNGTVDINYHVVFPYRLDQFDLWKKVEPLFNTLKGDCINSLVVSNVYNNFQEAEQIKNKKNEELFHKSIAGMDLKTLKENYLSLKEQHNAKISYYDQLENNIEVKLQNLKVDEPVKEQSVIIVDSKPRKSDISLYEVVDLLKNENFMVYSVSNDEYEQLQQIKHNGKELDNFKHTPLLINNKELNEMKLIIQNDKEKYLQDGKIIDAIDDTFELPNVYDAIFYTLEDYQDIMKSYHHATRDNDIKLTRKK